MTDADASRTRPQWRDRLPWLLLLRALRPAVSVKMLLCALAGLLLMTAGWRVCWRRFANSQDPVIKAVAPHAVQYGTVKVWPAWPWEQPLSSSGAAGIIPDLGPPPNETTVVEDRNAKNESSHFGTLGTQLSKIGWTIWQLTLPFQLMFKKDAGWAGLAFSLLCGLWGLAVWAFIGGAMTRTMALQLTREEAIPWRQASGFALKHWLDYFTAPLYPLLGVLLATFFMMILGLFAQANWSLYVVALFWPLALLAGLFMAMLLLGLFFGWPLMWGTVSVESNDAFDALSRSYAYTFQRPLKYLFYGLVATVLGILGFFLVQYFADAVIFLTGWSLSWGATNERVAQVVMDPAHSYATLIIGFFNDLVRLLPAAFTISYFWSATTAIYLLLRRDIDAAELDEVQLDQEESFGLPSLTTDARGVPGVADAPAQPAH